MQSRGEQRLPSHVDTVPVIEGGGYRAALDFASPVLEEIPMKTLLLLLMLSLSSVRLNAATFTLDGNLTWEITDPRCTFKLDGSLQNNTPGGSGTIKLVLWATPRAFPSPGFIIAETTLGSISGGYQFSDFTVRTVSKVPTISGPYHFTIAVAEYTVDGWRNRLAVATGIRELVVGNFTGQKKWALPRTTVTPPFALMKSGDFITLKLKASALLNLFPRASQLKTTLDAQSTSKIVAKNSFGKRTPTYLYKRVTATYLKKKVPAGRLTLEYPASSSQPKATVIITLFFQGGSAGTYSSEEKTEAGTEITWGSFLL